mgnify:CR=1 FL=1
MMKANEARTMTEKAIELEVSTRKQRAEEYCEQLTDLITQACEAKRSEITVQDIPQGLYSYVIGICKDNGYTVTQLNNKTLVLHW